jgi:hypothetical protein
VTRGARLICEFAIVKSDELVPGLDERAADVAERLGFMELVAETAAVVIAHQRDAVDATNVVLGIGCVSQKLLSE